MEQSTYEIPFLAVGWLVENYLPIISDKSRCYIKNKF